MNLAQPVHPVPAPTPVKTPTGRDSLKCTWDSRLDNFSNHKKVCQSLNNDYTVPYTCDGKYTNICCTVSGIVNSTVGNKSFGFCRKAGVAEKPTKNVATE